MVHRLVAAAMIGRELTKDEEAHHLDGDRRNPRWNNLLVLGQRDHSWVSSRQAWYMREKDRKEKLEWDKFMNEKVEEFVEEVTEARANGKPWVNGRVDGELHTEWGARHGVRD